MNLEPKSEFLALNIANEIRFERKLLPTAPSEESAVDPEGQAPRPLLPFHLRRLGLLTKY